MKESIARLFIPFAGFVHDMIAAIPMSAVRGLVFAVFTAFAIWVIRLGPQNPEDGQASPLSDLRIFGVVVLVTQIVLYIIF